MWNSIHIVESPKTRTEFQWNQGCLEVPSDLFGCPTSSEAGTFFHFLSNIYPIALEYWCWSQPKNGTLHNHDRHDHHDPHSIRFGQKNNGTHQRQNRCHPTLEVENNSNKSSSSCRDDDKEECLVVFWCAFRTRCF